MQTKFLMILPKMESYEFKSSEEKLEVRTNVRQMFDWATSLGYIPYMIAEDELAHELFANTKEIKWISSLSKMDSIFLITYSNIYNDYRKLSSNKYRNHYIAQSVKAIKKPEDVNGNNDEVYLATVHRSILQRIRLVSKLYIDEFEFVIYFSKSSNFTKRYVPTLGDGKVYIHYDLDTGIVEYTYAGISLDVKDIESILRESN